MKTMLKLSLMIALFASFALADGDMGSGGRTDPPPPPCTENCGSAMQGGSGSGQTSDNASLQASGTGSWITPADVILAFGEQAFGISF